MTLAILHGTLFPWCSRARERRWHAEQERANTASTDLEEREREFFIDNLLFRIHLIIVMILVYRPCAMGV